MNAVRLRVDLGPRAYDIHIGQGLLEQAGDILSPLLEQKRVFVITDHNVAAAQGDRLKRGLARSSIASEYISLPPGEETKSFAQLESLLGRLLDLGVERGDLLVAFGGGVIGDLAGFAAAILRRGCRFVQIPTTLLAQVDSAVGGKTAINAPQGKNLIGAFHQPSAVIADISTLNSLPERQLRAGYAEVVKYGFIEDAAFFEWLESTGKAVLAGDPAARIRAIERSCAAKARFVTADERERNKRALLNFGHTFGHAFEAAGKYSNRLLHGEAVALGMSLAFDYSVRCKMAPQSDAQRAKAHLHQVGLPVSIADLDSEPTLSVGALAAALMQDKKVESGQLTLILARKIGDVDIVKNASLEDVTNFLQDKIAL
jgi:3-dehydroquinate synthase